MNKPTHLEKGDTIGIVAPAWSINPIYIKRGVKKLEKLGYKVKIDQSIFKMHWSMAGHDKERAEVINNMFSDESVKAIFCAKAGYGSIRTVPYLNEDIIKKNPKIFIGYSDITILLLYLLKVSDMVVFHGPTVSGEIFENMNPITLQSLIHSISCLDALGELTFPTLEVLRHGMASGTLIGGNLSMIVRSLGTPYEIDTDHKILFLEEICEGLEMIDSYLMHLKLAKKLDNIKGILFGRMIECRDYSRSMYTIKDLINDILPNSDIPIMYGFPSGHRSPKEYNITIPLGVKVTLDTQNLKVVFIDAGVV